MGTDEDPQKAKKFAARQFVGGISVAMLGVGVYSWFSGREVPWGYTQTFGAVLVGVGLLGILLAALWPRRP
jgi:hypothetical protein